MTRSARLQLIVHQSRFLVLDAEREPNSASQLLAVMIRELPRQWEECFGYRPLLAETFTDPEPHHGTCYQSLQKFMQQGSNHSPHPASGHPLPSDGRGAG